MSTSNLYSSPAMHVTAQPMFLNAAIWVKTRLSSHQLLKAAKKAESVAGRDFGGRRWGPRPLDIDIIFHEGVSLDTEELTIPHPRWQDRAFVCRPVLDLCTPETVQFAWVRSFSSCSIRRLRYTAASVLLLGSTSLPVRWTCLAVGPSFLQGARGHATAARPTAIAAARLGAQTRRLPHLGLSHTRDGNSQCNR